MRVLICGGRGFTDHERLNVFLDYLHKRKPFTVVIHGCSRGADYLAGTWACRNGIPVEKYPADWTKYGKAAGPIRNREMLEKSKPELVIAFPGGKGTDNMVRQAKLNNIPVIQTGWLK